MSESNLDSFGIMGQNELSEPVEWAPDLDEAEIGAMLGAPCYGENRPDVNQAWQRRVEAMRSLTADWHLFSPHLEEEFVPQAANEIEAKWKAWHMHADEQRQAEAQLPVFELSQVKDGLGDIFLNRPGALPEIGVNTLFSAPFLASAIFKNVNLTDPDTYLLSQQHLSCLELDRSPGEMTEFSQNLQAIGQQIIGQHAFARLVQRELEDGERRKAFVRALAFDEMTLLPMYEQVYAAPSDLRFLRSFDAVQLAASFVRWLDFWQQRDVGLRVIQTPLL
jgi:hypothetical protein